MSVGAPATREPAFGLAGSEGQYWKTFLTLVPDAIGQLPARHLPFLAVGDLGPLEFSLTAILYPTGMRRSLLARCLGPVNYSLDSKTEEPTWGAEFCRVRDDLHSFASLDIRRQAEVAAILNCLTEQRLLVPLIVPLGNQARAGVHGAALTYEAARAIIRVAPSNPSARAMLSALARDDDCDMRVRCLSFILMAAMMTRIDAEAGAAHRFLEEGDEILASMNGASLDAVVIRSRWARVQALVSTKQKDPAGAAAHISEARARADQAIQLTSGAHPYPALVAAENLKMVLESTLLASGYRRSAQEVAAGSLELLSLDRHDSYTWRTVATATSRAGMTLSASSAMAGVAMLGGTGLGDVIRGIDAAAPASDRATDEALASSLRTLLALSY